jgi:nucleoid DNA-binding protein
MPDRDHPNDPVLDTVEEAVRRDDDFSVRQFGELRNRAARLGKTLKAP